MSYNIDQVNIVGNGASYIVPVTAGVSSAINWVCIMNNSPYSLNVTVGIRGFTIPAQYYWPIHIEPNLGVTLPIRFITVGDTPNNLAYSWYSATIYEYSEAPTHGLEIPMSILAQIGITGTISTVPGQTNSVKVDNLLINDGSTIGDIVEATLYNSIGSNLDIKNDGTMTVSEYVSATLTKLLQVIVGSGVKVGAINRLTEVLGNLQIDGSSMTVAGATTLLGGTLSAQSITSSGAITTPSVKFATGSLTRISKGSVLVGQQLTTVVNHGLGVLPDIVLATNTVNSGSGSSYAIYGISSTQFTIYQYCSAGISQTYTWLAIKL